MSVAIAQQSTQVGKGHWKWSVWLDGAAAELDEVAGVEYTLHPTFSPPVHRVTDRASAFRLTGSGWGEFMIHTRVHYRDGRSESLHHWLELADETALSDIDSDRDRLASPSSDERPGTTDSRTTPFPPAPAARVDPVIRPGEFTRMVGAPRPARSLKPRAVFLSSALADRLTAAKIHTVLEQDEFLDVSTSQELQSLEADAPVEQLIRNEMRRVGGAVFVVSERESPWLHYELAAAKDLGIPTAIVMVGTVQGIPSESAVPDLQLEITGPADAEQAAHEIAGWAEGLD